MSNFVIWKSRGEPPLSPIDRRNQWISGKGMHSMRVLTLDFLLSKNHQVTQDDDGT